MPYIQQINKNGYPVKRIEHSNLIHRQVAYIQIYLNNREKYQLPFSKYVVHHKDGNKRNFSVDNLELLTKRQHNKLHRRLKEEKEEFIEISMIMRIIQGFFGYRYCRDCGRKINHKGRCLACNIRRKRERES